MSSPMQSQMLAHQKSWLCAVDDCERQQIKPNAVPRFALSYHMFPAMAVQWAAVAAVPCHFGTRACSSVPAFDPKKCVAIRRSV